MNLSTIHKILTFCIAAVWIVNGLFCKVLNLVPRHEQIVAEILGDNYSRILTILIGLSEIAMAIWFLSNYRSRLNAVAQIGIVATMMKNHPFAVEAFFESSTVLTFAVPKEQLAPLIPECLRLDTFQDKWAFVAVAMVQTKNLRPKGFPKFMGNDFFLIGYRVFVRYTTKTGKNLRGLYILKSETDKKKMEIMGNTFTHYNYTTTDINQTEEGKTKVISSIKSNFKLTLGEQKTTVPLPKNSPFANWKEARRFAGPLPFTFTYNEKTKKVLIIQGVRQNWKPSAIKVLDYNFEFLNTLNLQNSVLANAFVINNIPYYWKKGKSELWN